MNIDLHVCRIKFILVIVDELTMLTPPPPSPLLNYEHRRYDSSKSILLKLYRLDTFLVFWERKSNKKIDKLGRCPNGPAWYQFEHGGALGPNWASYLPITPAYRAACCDNPLNVGDWNLRQFWKAFSFHTHGFLWFEKLAFDNHERNPPLCIAFQGGMWSSDNIMVMWRTKYPFTSNYSLNFSFKFVFCGFGLSRPPLLGRILPCGHNTHTHNLSQ